MSVRLLVGDCRELLRDLPAGSFDCCITDPPYGDTSLDWDSRCEDWLEWVAWVLKPAASIWVFGSMRFLASLFAKIEEHDFRYSQDVIWKKQNGSGFHADRFRRVHEHAVMFYRGEWRDIYHDPQFTQDATARTVRRKKRPAHTGHIEASHYVSEDGGPRLMTSVIEVRNEHGRAIHPTQKPVELLLPLIRYSCPVGGLIIDPFAGSGSVGVAAEIAGRSSVLIEADADYAEKARLRIFNEAPLFVSTHA